MTNPFDKFDSVKGNPFDKFDAESNPFDKFETSPLKAGAKSAVESALPAAGGLLGAGQAISYGSPLIAASGPFAPLTTLGLGLAGGLAGGYLTGKAQEAATSQIPASVKEATGFDPATRQLEEQQNPNASFIGGLAPNLAAFRPGSLSPIVTEGGRIISPLMQRLGMAGIGGGVEAGQELWQNGEINPAHVAEAAAFQGVAATPTKLGKMIFPEHGTPAKKALPAVPDDSMAAKARQILTEPDETHYTPTQDQLDTQQALNRQSQYEDAQDAANKPTGYQNTEESLPPQPNRGDLTDQTALPFTDDISGLKQPTPPQGDLFHGMTDEIPKPLTAEGNGSPKTRLETPTQLDLGFDNKLRPTETPSESTPSMQPSSLESAVDKISNGQRFAMSAEERIAWERTKIAVESADPGMRTLSDKDVFNRVSDRQWIQDAIDRITQRKAMFDEIAQRSNDRQDVADANRRREVLQEHLDNLQDTLQATRPDRSGKAQGPVTKAAIQKKNAPLGSIERATAKKSQESLHPYEGDGTINLNSGIPFTKEHWEATKQFAKDTLEAFHNQAHFFGKYDYGQKESAMNFISKIVPEVNNPGVKVGESMSVQDVLNKFNSGGFTDVPFREGTRTKIPFTDKSLPTGTMRALGQVGMNRLASRTGENPILVGTSNFFSNALSKTNFQTLQLVQPIEKTLSILSSKELTDLHGVMLEEARQGKELTDGQLSQMGMSQAQENAYKMLRKANDTVLDLENQGRALSNLKPVSKLNAYMSSRWTGDYQSYITKDKLDANGNKVLNPDGSVKQEGVWMIKATTRAEAQRAIAHLKDNYPELNIEDNHPISYKKVGDTSAPRDLVSAYQDMLANFSDNPLMTDAISESMQNFMQTQAYGNLKQNQHFLKKSGIRGFAGDQPWLSPKENAYRGMKAQMDYLRNGIKWSNTQEAISKTKQLLSDPNIAKTNAAAFATTMMNRELGLDANLIAPLESYVAGAFGTSRGEYQKFVGGAKSLTYGLTLGFNTTHSLFTALSAPFGTIPESLMLRQEGYKYGGGLGVAKIIGQSMVDASATMISHIGSTLGVDKYIPGTNPIISDLGHRAALYYENSGAITRNHYTESRNIGEGPVGEAINKSMSATVAQPENFARLQSFMTFVHQLANSGEFKGSEMDMFQMAEARADRAMGSVKSFDRPLIATRLGSAGQLGMVFKSYLFTQMHQYLTYAQQLAKGNAMPMAGMMATYALLAGVPNMPGMPEVQGLVDGAKNLVAWAHPELYGKVKDFDARDFLVGHLPDTAGLREGSTARSIYQHGLYSTATGADLSSQMNPQIVDFSHPAANNPFTGGAVAQEMREMGSIAHMVNRPSWDAAKQAAYQNLVPGSLGKNLMQEYVPGFKDVGNVSPQGQAYWNPSTVGEPEKTLLPTRRTPEDIAYRNLGLTSLNEGTTQKNWFFSKEEQQRREESAKDTRDLIVGAVQRQQPDNIEKYVRDYMQIDPQGKLLSNAFTKGAATSHFTSPELAIQDAQHNLIAAQAIGQFQARQKANNK